MEREKKLKNFKKNQGKQNKESEITVLGKFSKGIQRSKHILYAIFHLYKTTF